MKIFVTGQDTPIGKELIQRGYEPLRCDVLDIDDKQHVYVRNEG